MALISTSSKIRLATSLLLAGVMGISGSVIHGIALANDDNGNQAALQPSSVKAKFVSQYAAPTEQMARSLLVQQLEAAQLTPEEIENLLDDDDNEVLWSMYYESFLGEPALNTFDTYYDSLDDEQQDRLADDYYSARASMYALDEIALNSKECQGDYYLDEQNNYSIYDPTFMNKVNLYATTLYKFCEKLGILDQHIIDASFEEEKILGSTLTTYREEWMNNHENHSEYAEIFDFANNEIFETDETVYVSNYGTILRELPNIGPTWRDLFTLDDRNTPSVGPQTGSGETRLRMVSEFSREFGGTAQPKLIEVEHGTGHYNENGEPTPNGNYDMNPNYNPDEDPYDGLGDNLAFTVPSSINYVVKVDGSLLGPNNAVVENRSVLPIHASSLEVQELEQWSFVKPFINGELPNKTNAINLKIGPTDDQLDMKDFVNGKTPIKNVDKWAMKPFDGIIAQGLDTVSLNSSGKVANLTEDIFTSKRFGQIHWYMTFGDSSNWQIPVFDNIFLSESSYNWAGENFSTVEEACESNGFSTSVVEIGGYGELETINDKFLATTSKNLHANMGDWLTLHLSDGGSIDVIVYGNIPDSEDELYLSSTLQDKIAVNNDGLYSTDNPSYGATFALLGEIEDYEGFSDFTPLGHPGATIVGIENHGKTPELGM